MNGQMKMVTWSCLWQTMEKLGRCGGVEVDQVRELIHQLKTNPDSRRLIISAWNVADFQK